MMVKAVFFDWFNTLIHPEPERHEVYLSAYRGFGIELHLKELLGGILRAEENVPEGNPVKWLESVPQEPFIRYQGIVQNECEVKVSPEVARRVIRRLNQRANQVSFALYDDVLPAFERLKRRGLILGLLTNMEKGMRPVLRGVGLEPYCDVVVTSEEAGANKPEAPIFLLALKRADVSPQETVYVGDQYGTDVLGAWGVGIAPILINRLGLITEIRDCPQIQSLAELDSYLFV